MHLRATQNIIKARIDNILMKASLNIEVVAPSFLMIDMHSLIHCTQCQDKTQQLRCIMTKW